MSKKSRNRNQLTTITRAQAQDISLTRVESGPIPSPDSLARYAQIDVSLVDRLVRMAESEQAHRHEQERAELSAFAKWQGRGQLCAITLGLGALSTAAWAIYRGETSVAIAAITSIAAIVGAFLWKERSERKDAAKRDKNSDTR